MNQILAAAQAYRSRAQRASLSGASCCPRPSWPLKGDSMEFIVLLFLFGCLIAFSKESAIKKGLEIDASLEKLQREIVAVSGSTIHNFEITRVIGLVRGVSNTQASSKEEFLLAEKEALYNILGEAKNPGANAIIEIKLGTGTYQMQGSQWQVSQAIYTGTAVESKLIHAQQVIQPGA